jgi:hypothetical protein
MFSTAVKAGEAASKKQFDPNPVEIVHTIFAAIFRHSS